MAEITRERIQAARDKAQRLGLTDKVEQLDAELQRMEAPIAPPAEEDPSLAESAYRSIFNIPSSAYNMGADVVRAVSHPIETAQGMGAMAEGGLQQAHVALGENLPDWLKEDLGYRQKYSRERPTKEFELAGEVGQHFKNRYGSWKGIKKTLETDPVGLVSDVSGLLMPATLAKNAPGVLGKAANLVGKTGEAIQPSRLVTGPAARVARFATKYVPVVGEEAALAKMRRMAPSPETVQAVKKSKYDEVAAQGYEYLPQDYKNLAGNLKTAAEQYTPELAPVSTGIVNKIRSGWETVHRPLQENLAQSKAALANLSQVYHGTRTQKNLIDKVAKAQQLAATGVGAPFKAIDDMRRLFLRVGIGGKREASDLDLAREGLKAVGAVEKTLPDNKLIAEARDYGRRGLLDTFFKKIEDRGGFYLGGYESGVRNQMSSFLKKNPMLSKTEADAALKVIEREGARHVMESVGGRLGLLAGAATGAAGGALHPVIGLPAAIGANLLMRKRLESLVRKDMTSLRKTILAGHEAQAKAQAKADIAARIQRGVRRGAAVVGTYARPYGEMTE